MPNWKKVITSGSKAHLNEVTASGFKVNGDGDAQLEVEGSITSSNDISASGVISTTTLQNVSNINYGTGTVGDIDLSNSIIQLRSTNSGTQGLKLYGGAAGAASPYIGTDTHTSLLVQVNGSNIGLFNSSGFKSYSNITASAVECNDITASGIVSSSQDFRLGYKPDAGSYISASSDGTIEISGSGDVAILDVEGAITASAISSSGALFGSTFTNDSTVAGSSITGSVTGSFTGDGSNLLQITAKYVTITDNENTNEDNAIIFTAGGDVDGGNLGLESDGDLTYNPSTGRLTATQLAGTLQTAAQTNITSVGALNAGSITSGFTSIDVGSGAITTTGTATLGTTLTTVNKFEKTGNTDAEGQGDVVYFGGTTSMDAGKIYHYKSDGTWELADADTAATSDGLLAVALGAASDTNGMLLRGMVTLDHDPGEVGDVLYLQNDTDGNPGEATSAIADDNNQVVRVIGYCLDASNGQIWFNPSSTFVEVSA